ncbi:MAG: hypothetical protein K2M07_07680 [Muribaculaceae bacterium]|nr:hypothetical protein [Muribaculaceae bacterium]
MKKVIALLLALCVMLPAAIAADNNKALQKARNKERKEVMKRYKKEGWKLFGSSRSLEVVLLSHWAKLDKEGEDTREVMGVSTRSKSKNVGLQMSINNACLTYAQQAGSQLKGRVISDLAGDGIDTDAEFEHFYAAYERLVEKEIKGEMEQSYSIIRDNPDGTYEIETYFTVSENAATKARLRALENALKESEAAQKYADKVSQFVREGFNN